MKFNIKTLFGLAIGTTVSFSACTDLKEDIYAELIDESIDLNDPEVVGSQIGEAMAQFRFLYWGWNGYFDVMEECSDTYSTP